uniref:Uncharacterized protein n=1 Tax=Janibacter limosus TaxID=53458 RepID=A0AC61U631_9MICO|nr:hypothetical protein [Janibacter limosus]
MPRLAVGQPDHLRDEGFPPFDIEGGEDLAAQPHPRAGRRAAGAQADDRVVRPGDGHAPRLARLVHGVGVAVEQVRSGPGPTAGVVEGPLGLGQPPGPAVDDDGRVDLDGGVDDVDEQVLEPSLLEVLDDGLDGRCLLGEQEHAAALARRLGDDRGDEAGDARAGRGIDIEVLPRGDPVEDGLLVGGDVEDRGVGDAVGLGLRGWHRLARDQGRRGAARDPVAQTGRVGERLCLAVGEGGQHDPGGDVELGQVRAQAPQLVEDRRGVEAAAVSAAEVGEGFAVDVTVQGPTQIGQEGRVDLDAVGRVEGEVGPRPQSPQRRSTQDDGRQWPLVLTRHLPGGRTPWRGTPCGPRAPRRSARRARSARPPGAGRAAGRRAPARGRRGERPCRTTALPRHRGGPS